MSGRGVEEDTLLIGRVNCQDQPTPAGLAQPEAAVLGELSSMCPDNKAPFQQQIGVVRMWQGLVSQIEFEFLRTENRQAEEILQRSGAQTFEPFLLDPVRCCFQRQFPTAMRELVEAAQHGKAECPQR